MHFSTNQPNQKSAEQPAQAATPRQYTTPPAKNRRDLPRKYVVLGGALLVLVLVGLFWSWWLFGRNTVVDENKGINKDEYQAVFLTNGQVYFGKLADLNNKYVTITDVYYLQVQQNNSLQGASSSTSPNSQVSLVKLGNELHGPEDKMNVASGQMLFWENMKNSSKVTQAIDKYQNQ